MMYLNNVLNESFIMYKCIHISYRYTCIRIMYKHGYVSVHPREN